MIIIMKDAILAEIRAREPIFHHPDNFGKTKQDILAQMADEFWEVGASGNIYTKQEVVEELLERYSDPDYQDVWSASDFKLTQIAVDNYLLTYNLLQDKVRKTRRATIWRKIGKQWQIVYHQGTIVE